tara:strand:- start:2445 stop:3326 length:882 start_codon:yes stop_codon:yes gene_type:complete
MNDQTLTAKVYSKLGDVDRQLRKQSWVDKKRSQQWVTDFLHWCDEQHIELGSMVNHQSLRFDRALIQQVNAALESQRLTTIGQWQSGLTSAAQAEQGVNEDKANREGPRAQRVLVNTPASPPAWLSAQPRSMHDVDWRDINLDQCDVLIQVENLDSFYSFSPQIPALGDHPQPLVVYRGDSHYGGAFKQLASAWNATQKPHFYAGDFDVEGLGIALSSGASHLLLPSLESLTEQATTFHDPANQLEHRPRLQRHRDQLPAAHPLQPYLTLLLDQQRGLRQQWLGEWLERVALV